MQQSLVEEFPTVAEHRLSLATCLLLLARSLDRSGSVEVDTKYRKALKLFEDLYKDDPTAPEHRHGREQCLTSLGTIQIKQGNLVEAESMFRESLAISQSLSSDFPSFPQYRELLAGAHQNMGWILSEYLADTAAAQKEFGFAMSILEALTKEFPSVLEYRSRLARSHFAMGYILAHDTTLRNVISFTFAKLQFFLKLFLVNDLGFLIGIGTRSV